MLTFDQTLESLALDLPRIGGDLAPYTLPIVLTFERELYPYLVAAVQSNAAAARNLSPDFAEKLKTFAQNLTRTGRRALLVRALDLLVADAYAVAEPQLGADYDRTERMPVDVRSFVRRTWDVTTSGVGATWGALLAALIQMYHLHVTPEGARIPTEAA